MNGLDLTVLLAGVIAGATPILLATLGETITERGGLINLSLDGSILLCAMTAFVISSSTGNLGWGFLAAALVGAAVAALVAVFSVYLRQSQVAVGFVLTLMTKDLAYFIGSPYARLEGPQVSPLPIPGLSDIPVLGPILFSHNLPVYGGLLMILGCWWYLYHTRSGLVLRAVGENPRAAYARGINPRRVQLRYAAVGGLFVGLAGASFSLCIKPGWGQPQGCEGTGWIALALVIFGGWHPVKAAIGAFLFAFLQVISINLQDVFPSIPAQVFQVAPFPIMIFTLLLVYLVQSETATRWARDKRLMRALFRALSANAPAGLGKPYSPD